MNKTFKKLVAMAAAVGMALPMAVVPAFAATPTKYYADVDEITITYSEDLTDTPAVSLSDNDGPIATTKTIDGKDGKKLIVKPADGTKLKRDHIYTINEGEEIFQIKTIADSITDNFAESKNKVGIDSTNELMYIIQGNVKPNVSTANLNQYSVKFDVKPYLFDGKDRMYFAFGWEYGTTGSLTGWTTYNPATGFYTTYIPENAIDDKGNLKFIKYYDNNHGGVTKNALNALTFDKNGGTGKVTLTKDVAPYVSVTQGTKTEYDSIKVVKNNASQGTVYVGGEEGTITLPAEAQNKDFMLRVYNDGYGIAEVKNFVLTTYEKVEKTIVTAESIVAGKSEIRVTFDKDISAANDLTGVKVTQGTNDVEVNVAVDTENKNVLVITPKSGTFTGGVASTVTIPQGFGGKLVTTESKKEFPFTLTVKIITPLSVSATKNEITITFDQELLDVDNTSGVIVKQGDTEISLGTPVVSGATIKVKRADNSDFAQGASTVTIPAGFGGQWMHTDAEKTFNFTLKAEVLAPVKYYADEDGMTIEFNKDLTSFTNINGIVVKQNEVEVPTTATKDGKVITLTPAGGAKFAKDVLSTVTIPADFGDTWTHPEKEIVVTFAIKTIQDQINEDNFVNGKFKDGKLYFEGKSVTPAGDHYDLNDYTIKLSHKYYRLDGQEAKFQQMYLIWGMYEETPNSHVIDGWNMQNLDGSVCIYKDKKQSWAAPWNTGKSTINKYGYPKVSQKDRDNGVIIADTLDSDYDVVGTENYSPVDYKFTKHGNIATMAVGNDVYVEDAFSTAEGDWGITHTNGYFTVTNVWGGYGMHEISKFEMTTFVLYDTIAPEGNESPVAENGNVSVGPFVKPGVEDAGVAFTVTDLTDNTKVEDIECVFNPKTKEIEIKAKDDWKYGHEYKVEVDPAALKIDDEIWNEMNKNTLTFNFTAKKEGVYVPVRTIEGTGAKGTTLTVTPEIINENEEALTGKLVVAVYGANNQLVGVKVVDMNAAGAVTIENLRENAEYVKIHTIDIDNNKIYAKPAVKEVN